MNDINKTNEFITIHQNTYIEPKNNNICYKYCVNCGIKGHVIKNCEVPITSFGIIAYKICYDNSVDNYDVSSELRPFIKNIKRDKYKPVIKFLMIQRKNTMGYIDFMRGKYSDDDYSNYFFETREGNPKNLLKTYIEEMTSYEKHLIKNMSFEDQWTILWKSHSSKSYINEARFAKKKYARLNIDLLFPDTSSDYHFTELSFPKGRKNMREQNIECAEREFAEETGYTKNDYRLIKSYKPVEEIFTGTNDVKYRHVYYLVKCKSNIHSPFLDISNNIQTAEVKSINWLTYDECTSLIRPYDIAKKNILQKVNNDIIGYINKNVNIESTYNTNLHPYRPSTNLSLGSLTNSRKKERITYLYNKNYLIDTLKTPEASNENPFDK